MRFISSFVLTVVVAQLASAQMVVFWDEAATIGANGKYHGGLHFTQDKVYVEYVLWSSDGEFTGGEEVHVHPASAGPGTDRLCERLHDEEELIVFSPENAPRRKLKSMIYQYDRRTLDPATLYVYVGNKDAPAPTTKPGGEGWYRYELPIKEGQVPDDRGRVRKGKLFAEFDFQAQDPPPPRGQRFYIAFDNKADVFIDDVQFVR